MEAYQPLDEDLRPELGLSSQILGYLRESAKWGKFLAIVGFVMCGFIAIMALFAGSIISMFSGFPASEELGGGAMAGFGAMITVLYLLLAVLYFFPSLYLYRFSTKVQEALRTNDQETLTYAFENHKSLYKFWGIFTAIFLGFYALLFLIGGMGAMFVG